MNKTVPSLAIDFMNDDHQAFEQLLKSLQVAISTQDATEAASLLERLSSEARQHFEQEEAAMRSINFPPYATHKRNHDDVLEGLSSQLQQWQSEQDWTQLQHYLDNDLSAWFYQHISTMDAMTAKFLAR